MCLIKQVFFEDAPVLLSALKKCVVISCQPSSTHHHILQAVEYTTCIYVYILGTYQANYIKSLLIFLLLFFRNTYFGFLKAFISD